MKLVCSRIAVIFAVTFIVTPSLGLVVGGVGVRSPIPGIGSNYSNAPEASNLSGVNVMSIGHGNSLFSSVNNAIKAKGASVTPFSDIPGIESINQFRASRIGPVLAIFDGDWVQGRVSDALFCGFLVQASSKGFMLVAIGGHTSALYDVLNRTGIYFFEPGRNPVYFDPAFVGYRRVNSGDAVWVCNSSNIDDITNTMTNSLKASATVLQATNGGPYLQWVKGLYYTPLIDHNPHGKLNVLVDIYKELGDGTTVCDWYFYMVKLESVPGKLAYYSDWRTKTIGAHFEICPNDARLPEPPPYTKLVDYGPTTTSGQTTISYTISAGIGPQGPSGGFSTSVSYAASDVSVTSYSDLSINRAWWDHNLDPSKNVAMYSYLAKPSFAVWITQNHKVYVNAQFLLVCAAPYFIFFWQYWGVYSSTLYMDAYYHSYP